MPIDFLGVNLYRRSVIAAGDELSPINYRRVNPPGEYTLMGWEVSPNALYDTLVDVNRRYAPEARSTSPKTARRSRMLSPPTDGSTTSDG